MPHQAMVAKSNEQLAAQSVPRIIDEYPEEVERLGERGTLVPVARKVLGLSGEEAEYLQAMPSALREGLRASIFEALANGKPVQMIFTPAYEFSLKVWDYGQAVSVQLEGPYEAGGYGGDRPTTAKRKTTKRKSAARKAVKRKPARKSASRARKRAR